jgi:hypothetical protein
MAKSKSKMKDDVRRTARKLVTDERFHGRCVKAMRDMVTGAAGRMTRTAPRRTARIGARVRPTIKGRLTSLAQVTGKTEAEIIELAIGRLLPSDIIGPSWASKLLFWR